MEKIQANGLNKQALQSFDKDIKELAVDIWNEEYGTQYPYTTFDKKDQFPTAFIAVTLYGMDELSKFDPDVQEQIKEIFKDEEYQGIDSTTQKKLEKTDGSQEAVDSVYESRKQEIFNGLFFGLYRYYETSLADKSGMQFVGAISLRDGKVRPRHVANDGHFWKKGLQNPWRDYNCRCTYKWFKTADEAKAAGFTQLTSLRELERYIHANHNQDCPHHTPSGDTTGILEIHSIAR